MNKAKVVLTQSGKAVKKVAYTGKAITFSTGSSADAAGGTSDASDVQLTLKIGKNTLDSKTVEENFDIYYADHVEKGRATIILKAKAASPYVGACVGTFTITNGKLSK